MKGGDNMNKALHLKIQTALYERVKALAKEMNISMGSLVRIALTEYVNKRGE